MNEGVKDHTSKSISTNPLRQLEIFAHYCNSLRVNSA